MAKHAAPEAEGTTTSADLNAPPAKRSKNYPIIVEQALAYHMLEVFDHVERSRRICKALEQVVHDQLGLDVNAKILQLIQANNESPETGNQETYDYAILGLFFTNVTRDELDSYCAALLDYFAVPTHHLFSHPDYALPDPHFEVPSADELRAMTAEAVALRERTAKFVASDGTINRNAVNAEASKMRQFQSQEEADAAVAAAVNAEVDAQDEAGGKKKKLDAFDLF